MDNKQEGMKHQMGSESHAQNGMTLKKIRMFLCTLTLKPLINFYNDPPNKEK